ncbi:AcvB/VirJ family lysyl-phosphatidylglycerol hydrolase [Salmonirosea aquatica]
MKRVRWVILLVLINQWSIAGSFHLPADLPLTLIPTSVNSEQPLVFFISGDGGWIEFDQKLSETLSRRGMPVVGLDARKYFWKEKTPAQTTAELSAAIAQYMKRWNKKTFVLLGFSFGASIVPFVATRLAPDLQKSLRVVIALSPDERTDFEVHLADMLNLGNNKGHYNVLAEMTRIKDSGLVCLFGHDEDNAVEAKLTQAGIRVAHLPGGHHYDDNYGALAEAISPNTD